MSTTYLITGATAGIGYEATKQLALLEPNSTLLFPARSEESGDYTQGLLRKESGNSNIYYIKADLSSFAEVYALAKEVKERFGRLDVLINNAGVFKLKKCITVDGLEETIQVNYFTPFLLSHLLLDLLKKSKDARIVNVSSIIHFSCKKLDLRDLTSKDKFTSIGNYAFSKLALLLFTNQLAKNCLDQNIKVNSLHPGGIASKIGRGNVILNLLMQVMGSSVQKGASPLIYLAQDPSAKLFTGKYFDKENRIPVLSSPLSNDQAFQSELYQWTLDYFRINKTSLIL